MSKYTTELRFICEVNAGDSENKGYNDIKTILTKAAPKIFNFDFPIFDEKYRLPLEIKILRHYYTREISEETVGLWKLRLEDKLNLIMPYYNQLYKSELIQFNPLYDVDLIRDHNNKKNEDATKENNKTIHGVKNDNTTALTDDDTKINNTSTTTATQDTTINKTDNNTHTDTTNVDKNSTNWNLFSDTPQGGVNNISTTNLSYLTNATKTTSDETTNTTNNGNAKTSSDQIENNSANTSITDTGDETFKRKSTIDNNSENTTTENFTANDTITTTEDYLEHVRGKQGTTSYSKMLSEYRQTFLNIDKLVLNELQDLFFGLW